MRHPSRQAPVFRNNSIPGPLASESPESHFAKNRTAKTKFYSNSALGPNPRFVSAPWWLRRRGAGASQLASGDDERLARQNRGSRAAAHGSFLEFPLLQWVRNSGFAKIRERNRRHFASPLGYGVINQMPINVAPHSPRLRAPLAAPP